MVEKTVAEDLNSFKGKLPLSEALMRLEQQGKIRVAEQTGKMIILPVRNKKAILEELEAFKEKEHIFYVDYGNLMPLFKACKALKKPLLIKGPTGVGKTTFLQHMAQKEDLPLVTVLSHNNINSTDVVGKLIPFGDYFAWEDGLLVKAIVGGAIFYFDEVVNVDSETLSMLYSITDHRRFVVVPDTGELIRPDDKFMLVASYNPGSKYTKKKLPPAFEQRFICAVLEYPPPEVEKDIVKGNGINTEIASLVVRVMTELREGASMDFKELPGTRLSVLAAELIQNHKLSVKDAFRVVLAAVLDTGETIENILSDIVVPAAGGEEKTKKKGD
ncbi:MAG: AAA family ATPase [Candidatus Anstonellales archaeon]